MTSFVFGDDSVPSFHSSSIAFNANSVIFGLLFLGWDVKNIENYPSLEYSLNFDAKHCFFRQAFSKVSLPDVFLATFYINFG
jgi:hypothetical protein